MQVEFKRADLFKRQIGKLLREREGERDEEIRGQLTSKPNSESGCFCFCFVFVFVFVFFDTGTISEHGAHQFG